MTTTLTVRHDWTSISGDRTQVDQLIQTWISTWEDQSLPLTNANGDVLTGLHAEIARVTGATVVDARHAASKTQGVLPGWVRDYQMVAVVRAFQGRQGIIKATTGSGKTIVAAGLMSAAQVRWVFLVHKPDVVRAAAKSFRERLEEPVIELAGAATDWNGRILCATYDQLLNNPQAMEWLATAEGVLVDECHRAATKSAYQCILSATNACWRIGLSATPFNRSDKRDVITMGLLGEIIYEIKAQELIAEGSITPLNIQWVQCEHHRQGVSPRNWSAFYERHIVENDERNALLVNTITRCETPALLFVKRKNHALTLANELKMACPGKRVVCVDGDTSKEQRDAIVAAVNAKAVDYVVATSVFNEGIDASEFRSAVIGAGGQSWIDGLQRPGRLTRLASGKASGTVFDVADYGISALAKHTYERHAAYQSEGFNVADPFPAPELELPMSTLDFYVAHVPGLQPFVDVWRCLMLIKYVWPILLLFSIYAHRTRYQDIAVEQKPVQPRVVEQPEPTPEESRPRRVRPLRFSGYGGLGQDAHRRSED